MQDDLTTHLIHLERSLHTAETRNDPAATASLLSASFREFGSSGHIWTRDEIIAALASEPPTEFSSQDFTCQILSPELALLTYTTTHLASNRSSLRSTLWRHEDGSWRILFHQGTPIP
jgi:glyoxylase I family protein